MSENTILPVCSKPIFDGSVSETSMTEFSVVNAGSVSTVSPDLKTGFMGKSTLSVLYTALRGIPGFKLKTLSANETVLASGADSSLVSIYSIV